MTDKGPDEVAQGASEAQWIPDPLKFTVAGVGDETLLQEYENFRQEDPEVFKEALAAAEEMRRTPMDDLDAYPIDTIKGAGHEEGIINRRAPLNPFHSPLFGKQKAPGEKPLKGDDPALQSNPLRGKLLVTIGVNAALFMVFVQSLVSNRISAGAFYASRSDNSNLGPNPLTLKDLGGLNTNDVRNGEWIRVFWSMWMHSGWIHITLNILSQLQFFYMLEPDWGSMRTLLLFWFSGISGNLLSIVMDPCKTTVGSSGGLFGLMGGIVPYCIEFWNSIPRPLCILTFALITFVLSIATSLSKSTDTWAHLGGFLGGLLFGFGTITTTRLHPSNTVVKREKQHGKATRVLKRLIDPACKHDLREWAARLVAWVLLILLWILCLIFLLVKFEYQPLGSLTYSGITACCCCWSTESVFGPVDTSKDLKMWMCLTCDVSITGGITWRDHCVAQGVLPEAG